MTIQCPLPGSASRCNQLFHDKHMVLARDALGAADMALSDTRPPSNDWNLTVETFEN